MILLNRRKFLKAGTAVGLGTTGLLSAIGFQQKQAGIPPLQEGTHDGHGDGLQMPGVVGNVNYTTNAFNPTDLLTDFDYGTVSTLPDGRTLREYRINAVDKDIEIVPGLKYPAWTYNGRIPGPTLRATEGDRVRINFINGSAHAHTMHFHGIHTGSMDGVFELVETGSRFTYEFDAVPFGCHLYHCHNFPLAKHVAKGLYGAFIIDPKQGRPHVDHEYVMVQAGYDIDFDGKNDFYHVNGIPFHYDRHPIKFKVDETVRIYLVNILEYDPINSFHIHANFFNYYPTGTSLTPSEYTDTIMQAQAQRGIVEFSYPYSGLYMFHAHKAEFAELGWTGLFEVKEA
jgi:FtsP/CotA-like multicopper oxidase with cupredoxin domain